MKENAIHSFDLRTYQTLTAYNGDMLFEWDLVSDRFYATPNLFDIFGYMPPSENFTNTLDNSANIHPDDKKIIKEYLETIQFISHDLKSGKYHASIEIRLRNIYQKFFWFHISLIAEYSKLNMPCKIYGMMRKIDFDADKYSETPALPAQTDLVTGLSNAAAFEQSVTDYVTGASNQKSGAFVLIDIDGLKKIRQYFEEPFSDLVANDLAAVIKNSFMPSDLVGRLKDERFGVFIREVHALATLKKAMRLLNLRLAHTYPSGTLQYAISSSIGLALYPAHGKSYTHLYDHADHAARYSKSYEANSFLLYRDRLPEPLAKAPEPKEEPQPIEDTTEKMAANSNVSDETTHQ